MFARFPGARAGGPACPPGFQLMDLVHLRGSRRPATRCSQPSRDAEGPRGERMRRRLGRSRPLSDRPTEAQRSDPLSDWDEECMGPFPSSEALG